MMRIGEGLDVHRFAEGRELWLCGVMVPYRLGLLGHSDADVAIHALCDALFGALALGDIGLHFPDSNPEYKGIDSKILLRHTMELIRSKGWELSNTDITIAAQAPKLRPYIDTMRGVLAECMGVEAGQISVKATTTEGLGFEGRGEGISARAVVLLRGS